MKRYTKTKSGIIRSYNATINEARKRLRGGLQFGIDIPTLSICCPDLYQDIKYLKGVYNEK